MKKTTAARLLTACLVLIAYIVIAKIYYHPKASHLTYDNIIIILKPWHQPWFHGRTDSTRPKIAQDQKIGNETLFESVQVDIKAILSSNLTDRPCLSCPRINNDRYAYLQTESDVRSEGKIASPRYFFALDLYQCAHKLPRLLGSIVETMQILGPRNCALSIVEGRSDDGTYETLRLLQQHVEEMGAQYILATNELNPKEKGVDRIKALAALRNQALQPLIDHPDQYSPDTTVIFINDVSLCPEDILELVHQRVHQKADMTCAMDWIYIGRDPTFYDLWVARGINGDSFFNVPRNGSWNSAWNLFWNDSETRSRLGVGQPFQAFSCWNGAVAFIAKPIMEKTIQFRNTQKGECFQGEPQIFCKDMWYQGYGKIAVIPSINLGYDDKDAKKIKTSKGDVSDWVVEDKNDTAMQITWEAQPPQLIKCIPTYDRQTWVPWDEHLVEQGVQPGQHADAKKMTRTGREEKSE